MRMLEDVGAPAVVTLVDQVTLDAAPEWNEWAAYGLTAIGYVGGFLRFGGGFVKNLGVASLPLTVRHLRTRIAGGATRRASGPMAFRTASAYRPSNIRQTAVPEFEDVRVS